MRLETGLMFGVLALALGCQAVVCGSVTGSEDAGIRLHIKTTYTNELWPTFQPTDRVEKVKEFIEDQIRIPADEQELLLDGHELVDGRTLASYGIQDGAKIVQQKRRSATSIEITIKSQQGIVFPPARFEPTDRVEKIKEFIKEKGLVPVDEQELLLNGYELADGRTLASCGIRDGTVILQQRKHSDTSMELTIDSTSGVFPAARFEPSDRVETVKEFLEDRIGVPVAEQVLMFDGQVMRNGQTLESYGVKDWSLLKQKKKEASV